MVAFDQQADVALADRANPLLARCCERQRRLLMLATVLTSPKEAVDQGEHTSRRRAGRDAGVTGLLHGVAQHQMPVRVLVEDREIGAQAEMAAVLAQHVGREAVERRQARPAHVRTEQLRDSAAHLFGGLRGERESEDSESLVGGSLNEPHHSRRQHPGLAGPRPGEHQHGALVPVDGLPLIDVQGFEFEHGHALASAAALFRILDSSTGTAVCPAVIRAVASAATSVLL